MVFVPGVGLFGGGFTVMTSHPLGVSIMQVIVFTRLTNDDNTFFTVSTACVLRILNYAARACRIYRSDVSCVCDTLHGRHIMIECNLNENCTAGLCSRSGGLYGQSHGSKTRVKLQTGDDTASHMQGSVLVDNYGKKGLS